MSAQSKTESPSASESVQKLVYGISHDMGAPLRAVVQFSELLSQRLGDRLNEKEHYWFTLIHQNGVLAQRMIDALLVYSRLSDQFIKGLQEFELKSVLESLLEDMQHKIQMRHASLEIIGDKSTIFGCPAHWLMYFGCLIENSLLFQKSRIADESGQNSSEESPHIHIQIAKRDEEIEITVADNGIGVTERYRQQITAPFKRLNGEDYPGLGMGLTYCERIVNLQGGQLHFSESEWGGLKVTCQIPQKPSSLKSGLE